ncbi:hypothetical protein ACO2Q1_12490 [Brevundimonas sp. VNH65]|uniref:hypothetical protein n=1 Tax=Brevundimonas sp. VNH65 TaxID=3400917 RepID=UPI003BFFCCFE
MALLLSHLSSSPGIFGTAVGVQLPPEDQEAVAVLECRHAFYPDEVRCDIETVSSKAKWVRPAARILARSAERNHDLYWLLTRGWILTEESSSVRFRATLRRDVRPQFQMAYLQDASRARPSEP